MKIVDLSQTLDNDMPVYSGDPQVKIEQIHSIDKEGWRLKLLSFGSHTGSHVDAPAHMDKEGQTLDQLSVDKFIGKARVVGIEDIFPPNTGLVFSSGKIDVALFDKVVAAKPLFVVVGNEAELTVEMERKLLRHGIITFTDLVNLNKLPVGEDFTFYGVPLKIKSGDGSPIRAFAIVGSL